MDNLKKLANEYKEEKKSQDSPYDHNILELYKTLSSVNDKLLNMELYKKL